MIQSEKGLGHGKRDERHRGNLLTDRLVRGQTAKELTLRRLIVRVKVVVAEISTDFMDRRVTTVLTGLRTIADI